MTHESPKRSRPTDDPSHRANPVRWLVIGLWCAVPLAGIFGGAYWYRTAYRRFVLRALEHNVREVDVETRPSAPPVRLTSTQQIAQVRAWLRDATPAPAPGAAGVRPAACRLTVVYGDGRTEPFLIGNLDPAPAGNGAGASIQIRWRRYVRYAPEAPLRKTLEPNE